MILHGKKQSIGLKKILIWNFNINNYNIGGDI